jgi:hypothetical protein
MAGDLGVSDIGFWINLGTRALGTTKRQKFLTLVPAEKYPLIKCKVY